MATASFRDPAGHVVVLDGRVLRCVRAHASQDLDRFLESGGHAEFAQRGQVVATKRLHQQAADEDQPPEARWLGTRLEPGDRVLEHEKVAFPSYPYEWPAEMLHRAGLLTLELMERLLDEGLGLKDATPYNILYEGPEPVFIDVLSVEAREPRDPGWNAYAQFVRTMLLPLVAERRFGWRAADLLLLHRDGPPPEVLYGMSRWQDRLRSPFLSLVSIPTWLATRAEKQAQGGGLYEPRLVADAERADFQLRRLIAGLRRHAKRLAPRHVRASDWSGYMDSRNHYAQGAMDTKDRFVTAMLEETRPAFVLDAGCNTGHFSAMAARAGARVVAVDQDAVSVGAVWRRAENEGLDILPLVGDLARPTPALGWCNRECPSFLERAEGRFDAVFMLALMHHLHVSERIPIEEIVRLAWHLSRRHVVFEYVGPGDPMFRRLLRGRDHLHRDLDRARFEAALEGSFRIVRQEDVEPPEPGRSDRTLYLLERQEPV